MFLRSNNRKKNGKDHRYFSIVENHRLACERTVQRTVLYLGEINDEQQAAWRTLWEAFEGLEPDEGKLSRPVLRGPGSRTAAWLLGNTGN